MSSNGWPRLEFLSRMVGQDWSSSGLRCKARPEVFSWSSWPGQAYVGDYLWFSVYNLLSGDTQCTKAVKCLSFNHKTCGFPIFVHKRCGIPLFNHNSFGILLFNHSICGIPLFNHKTCAIPSFFCKSC